MCFPKSPSECGAAEPGDSRRGNPDALSLGRRQSPGGHQRLRPGSCRPGIVLFSCAANVIPDQSHTHIFRGIRMEPKWPRVPGELLEPPVREFLPRNALDDSY